MKDVQDITADLEPSRIQIYEQQVSNFVEIFEKNLNPFDPILGKNDLYNIATGKPVTSEVAGFLLNIEENGDILRKQFTHECVNNEDRFDKPIKKNQVLNFAAAPKKKKLSLEIKSLN